MHFLSLFLQIAMLSRFCLAFNVLGFFPLPFKSHFIGAKTLLQGLAADGHNVTMISPFTQKESIPNFVDFQLDGIEQGLKRKLKT